MQKRAVAGIIESSIRCAFHQRERVPVGIFSPGFPLTTLCKPGLKTPPLPLTIPNPDRPGGVLLPQLNPHKKRSTSHLVNLLISLSHRILGEAQLLVIQSCLSCCQTCDRHTEWGAGYVVKAYFVAELYRRRISAVLAADTALKVRTCCTAFLNCHLY